MVRSEKSISSSVYSVELEAQAQAWIEAVTGEAFQGEFAEELRDGRRLCSLMNAIKPGSIRRVNNSTIPFKKMENISNFIKQCRAAGVPEYSLFETVDLFELKDLGLVVNCLHALGGAVQLSCPDFSGPHLGVKSGVKSAQVQNKVPSPKTKTWTAPSSGQTVVRAKSPDASTPAQGSQVVPAAQSHDEPRSAGGSSLPPPTFNSGAASAATAAAGTTTSPTATASTNERPPPPPFNESATAWSSQEARLPPPPAYRERTQTATPPKKDAAAKEPGDLAARFSQAVGVADGSSCSSSSTPYTTHAAGNSAEARPTSSTYKPEVPAGPSLETKARPASPTASNAGPPSTSAAAAVIAGTTTPTASVSARSVSPPRSESASLSPGTAPVTKARGGGYGLDAELAERREANYDYQSEQEAQEWIEDVTGEPFVDVFGEELRSGRRLCLLINAIKPGVVRRVNDSRMPFKQMENISNFLKACRAVGVAEHSLFETVDLFEGKDLGLVVRCLHALGQTVQKTCPEYSGPRLGIKQTEANKREWTPEQQQQQMLDSSGAMSQLMAGSSKTMERGTIIKEGVTFGASTSGTGDAAVPARWTMGSQATMERANISKSGPTFGADYAGTAMDSNSSSMLTRGYR